MWILRFHLLQSKDYNKIERICKKYGFVSRSHSSLVYAKATVKYVTQKCSWRSLSREFHIDHAALAKFYNFSVEKGFIQEIFHVFLDAKSSLYIGEKRNISIQELDNSEEIFLLTKREIESTLSRLK